MSRAPWNKLRAAGSIVPERWLSFSGQVAQSGPEYSNRLIEQNREGIDSIDFRTDNKNDLFRQKK